MPPMVHATPATGATALDSLGSHIVALIPRRFALAAVLTIGVAGLQPVLAGQAFAATSLSTPTSLAPNSSSTPQKDPVLSWNAVSGATSYEVQLSKSSDPSDAEDTVTLPDSGATAVASYAVPQTLVHGVYFWRVRAIDGSDHSTWSAEAQLDRAWDDAPSIAGSTPSSDAGATQTGIASYPWRFAWTPVPDASSYEIELSSSPSFPQPGTVQDGQLIDGTTTVDCLTTATSWTPYGNNQKSTPDINVDTCDLSDLVTSGGLFWRVRAIDDSTGSLVTSASQKNTLECGGVPDSTGAALGESTTLALGTPSSTGQDCSLWSVRGNVANPTGDGTTVDPGDVTTMSLNCPTGTASDYACATTPEISWQPVVGAANYAVTIADDSNFTNIEHLYTTQFLSLTPRDQLADYTAGKGYYVAVQACNGDNVCGTATVKTFTKRTPIVSNLTATKVTGGVRLSWTDLAAKYATSPAGVPAVEAEDYTVQVAKATDPDFDSPVLTTTVDAACDSTVETCYSPSAHTSPGTDQTIVVPPATGSYIWRVKPIDLTGNALPAAADASAFTVDLTAPTFHISTKSGVAVSGPLTIVASEAVTGVSASTVQIVPEGKKVASAVAGKLTAGSAPNSWEFTPTKPLATGGSYVLSVSGTVTDQSGNSAAVTGAAVRTTTTAKNTSKGWTFSAGWKKHSASGALSGSYRSAATPHSAHVVVVGTEAELFACKGPTFGTVSVTVGGHTQKVSEHQSFSRCGVEVWHRAIASGQQTVTVKVTKGTGDIDEVTVA
jgi:hypothetical protein